MDLEESYDVERTVDFIRGRGFWKVALQFPDELLKDAVGVVRSLRRRLSSSGCAHGRGGGDDVKLFIMADTTYGSCCIDEVAAQHVCADCVVHYGHTCLSPPATLPAYFVLGKAPLNKANCANSLLSCAASSEKPVLVLYGLEYAYAMTDVERATSGSMAKFSHFLCSSLDPLETVDVAGGTTGDGDIRTKMGNRYIIGGLVWTLPEGQKMEDYLLYWIGSSNAAFQNVVLTFNGCDIVRYDATEDCVVSDFSQQRRILKRRYFLVEKAKDANIVGILVGTLGVAGYLHMINQMKELVRRAGKKVYTLAMGRPNAAKLANFPECDVFIYVSCAQTALLDSKEFLAPVITPFEAMLAFTRGSEWTGEYVMEFRDLINSLPDEVKHHPESEEARFSFLKGGYVEDRHPSGDADDENDRALALASTTQKALQLHDTVPNSLAKSTTAKSSAEYFAARSYRGLDVNSHSSSPEAFTVGRSGRAAGYDDEKH
ncbi:hypothetical protein MLD38_012041 [Melastoma candidum]|uniref:Uncharacterized protein n=1 Tax=Melastoma candidum TaxID=119954 RepID=A0ACB9R535_9MYRT|nr:hypothetical protein MLD38_012041 [Melastoma candidum]